MNILFTIKVKILVLIKWSHRSLNMLITEPTKIINIFWACNPISSKHMSLWLYVLRSTPNHKPLTYMCHNCCCVQFRHVYLMCGYCAKFQLYISILTLDQRVEELALPKDIYKWGRVRVKKFAIKVHVSSKSIVFKLCSCVCVYIYGNDLKVITNKTLIPLQLEGAQIACNLSLIVNNNFHIWK